MLCMFGYTYVRANSFSDENEQKHTGVVSLTLSFTPSTVSTAQSLTPNINELTAKKNYQANEHMSRVHI